MESLAVILLTSVAAYTDAKRGEIDDWVSIVLLTIGIISGIRNGDMTVRLIWCAAVFIPMILLALIRPDGIGGGDIKLYTSLALAMKQEIYQILFLSCLAAVIFALFTRRYKSPLRMGPFILLATIVVLAL